MTRTRSTAKNPKQMERTEIIRDLYSVILDRLEKRPAGSYTTYLFDRGEDKILKKIGEEASEVILASKNGGGAGLISETADLVYHLLVLLAWHGIKPDDISAELALRRASIK